MLTSTRLYHRRKLRSYGLSLRVYLLKLRHFSLELGFGLLGAGTGQHYLLILAIPDLGLQLKELFAHRTEGRIRSPTLSLGERNSGLHRRSWIRHVIRKERRQTIRRLAHVSGRKETVLPHVGRYLVSHSRLHVVLLLLLLLLVLLLLVLLLLLLLLLVLAQRDGARRVRWLIRLLVGPGTTEEVQLSSVIWLGLHRVHHVVAVVVCGGEGLQLELIELPPRVELVELKIVRSRVVHGSPTVCTVHGPSEPKRLLLLGVLHLLLLLLLPEVLRAYEVVDLKEAVVSPCIDRTPQYGMQHDDISSTRGDVRGGVKSRQFPRKPETRDVGKWMEAMVRVGKIQTHKRT